MQHLGKGLATGLLVSLLAVGTAMGQAPQRPASPAQGQPAQIQPAQPNQGQAIAAEMERAKARQAFQRGLTMARNAETRLQNLGETPENIEFLRQSIK